MKIIYKLITLILTLAFIFLNNCQSIRDNLSMKKKQNTDEFLVKKKNPLILPPNYDKLPKPTTEEYGIDDQEDEKIDFSKIFDESKKSSSNKSSDINKSIEDSIRKKIGNN